MVKPIDYAALTERRCGACKQTKLIAEFGRYADASAPLTGWRYYYRCKDCNKAQCSDYGKRSRPKRNARLSRWRKENPERAAHHDKKGRLKKKYGLTIAEADALLAANDGKCLICHDAKAVAIDHCHRTGRVRGGLCTSCNTFLGRVEANPAILTRMACHADVLLEIANAEGAQ